MEVVEVVSRPLLIPAIPHSRIAGSVDRQHTTLANSTAETPITTTSTEFAIAPYLLILTNTSATAVVVTINAFTGAANPALVFTVPANDTRGFSVSAETPLRAHDAYGAPWTATCGVGVTNLEVTIAWVWWP